jgi:N-hydroxyarylamine O-acetyltransferase
MRIRSLAFGWIFRQTRLAIKEPDVTDAPYTIDIGGYLARIGYSGPRTATLDTLRTLHALHPAAIAFENLDPLLGRRVHLDPLSMERKLVGARRGGYCFEQNGLFALALIALGFKVIGLAAHVYINQLPGRIRRSHMLLKIDLPEGPHIADVGFGAWALSGPLSLLDEGEQETPHGPFRVARAAEQFDVQTVVNGGWTTLYRFMVEEQLPQDYEVSNWYCATHPESRFTTELMVARLPAGRRLGMLNNRLSIHHPDGRTERRELKSAAEIAGVLETEFLIRLPEPRNEVMAAFAKLVP